MAYYIAALPVVYIGTQVAASRVVHAATNWLTVCEGLQDDTTATIDTAQSILNMYKTLKITHPAYNSRLHLQASLDSLVYLSDNARKKAKKWRFLRKDFTQINFDLDKQRNRVEQRIRLFREVTLLIHD
tara:strand:- start:13737 stop:14123 length:387 start_codon:yes stop_codon:yes gene_type:complete